MTFFGIPILAQFLARLLPCWGPGLPLFLSFAIYFYANNLSSTQRLYADAGRITLFFSGRVGNVSEFCYVGNNGWALR